MSPADAALERALGALAEVSATASEALGEVVGVRFAEADAQDGGGYEALLYGGDDRLASDELVGAGGTRSEALASLGDKLAALLDRMADQKRRAAADVRRAVGL
ncbi:MAG TPA: hypothetical protein VFS43_38220 [Polyangiaceae bacterium]|nr:hypothetical protein [Polyangiaceae bacterium]